MIHGGDIYRNEAVLDFSINVNPLGVPHTVRQALHDAAECCEVYPDIQMEKLRSAVGDMLQVRKEWLLFGNGASELFMAVVHALRPKRVVIPVPSFYGYEYAANAVSADIHYYFMKEENGFLPGEELFSVLDETVDLLFLADPNNPTGRKLEREFVLRLLRHCKSKTITVVLDECFIEFCEGQESVIDVIEEFPNVILIRAFTKIFSIPGVRLGYLVCSDPSLRREIGRQLPEWNVSVFAQMAGAACANEQEFRLKTAEYIAEERRLLAERFLNGGALFPCKIYPGSANFILLYCAYPLYDRLLEKKILIRDCSNFRGLGKGYYRIAVRTREENERLWKVIGEINWNE